MIEKLLENKTELLSPAGDYDCFLAAIAAGADAVYVGGPKFGARAYAKNFSIDELITAADHAHLYGRKLYLAVNTLVKNSEFAELYDYIKPIYEGGIDGIIVQDIGILKALSEWFPFLPLHASTQMAITGTEGVDLLKKMGVSRVVPARELSLDEIRTIRNKTGMEIECFIHGAMCYSYSGKCLFSSIVGGRSGNRGRCAGPCRLPYNDKYLLSAKDISTIEILPELIEAGIASFKIEGRMKSREYVAGVTGIYRKYIDRYYEMDSSYSVDEEDIKELSELYTRSGHCSGYYHKNNGRDMISIEKPSYDTAEDDRMTALYDKYTGRYDKLKCKAFIRACKGEEINVRIVYKDISVECRGPLVQESRNKPTGKDDIKKHFNKTGNTAFEFDSIKIESEDDIFIPVSVINAVRREALDLLKSEIVKGYKRKCPEIKKSDKKEGINKAYQEQSGLINIRLDSLKLLDTVFRSKLADIISIDVNGFCIGDRATGLNKEYVRRISERIHSEGARFFIALPPVIRRGYFERNKDIKAILDDSITDGVIIDNYESLGVLYDIGYKGMVIGDVHMYCLNDNAVDALNGLGVDVLTYPIELNAGELNHLDIGRGEFVLYGRAPMMISAQCIQKTTDKCVKDNGMTEIKDRLGNVFPVVRNCNECFNTILNCLPTMVAKKDIPSKIDPYSYRIHFTVEDIEEAKMILEFYGDFFKGIDSEPYIKRTLLHLKRGVQ